MPCDWGLHEPHGGSGVGIGLPTLGTEGRFFIGVQFGRVSVRPRRGWAMFYNLGLGLQLGA
ncbi:hypothetical protein SAMN05443245_4162 [Paraburkholderia fungorum]|uniref:Uncharacterized protein n=1 Tax=Paraburkholderia fungorum TaxID=134537 RepID=A0A1H1HQA3_9BURK|nr:hypothetical protein SAMN05443245_4162 [Paraburkholderia fungorum]